ncbi:MAG TPA: hypothetical protein VIG62_05575 [Blastocatellia bacterium]|jgi:hypothetical protein
MSSFDQNDSSSSAHSAAAEEIRKLFTSLDWDEKISTLVRVELDMVGDLVDAVVSRASRMVDEVAEAFSRSEPSDTPGANL